jgi:outer membrane murein-binding lipoprotein Lpp
MQLLAKVDHLGTKVDRLETKVDHLGTKVDRLETKVDRLETKVDRLETKVDHLEAKVDRLETKVDHLEAKVDEIDAKLTAVQLEQKAEAERISRLEGRSDTMLFWLQSIDQRFTALMTPYTQPPNSTRKSA